MAAPDQLQGRRLSEANRSLAVAVCCSVVVRRTVMETQLLGIRIPAGRLVSVMLHLGHHMPEYWPDPEGFDPRALLPAPA